MSLRTKFKLEFELQKDSINKNWIGPFVVGILLGYFIHICKNKENFKLNTVSINTFESNIFGFST